MKKSILLVAVVTGLMSTSSIAGEIKILKVLKSSELGERAPQGMAATRCGESVEKRIQPEVTPAPEHYNARAKTAK